VQRIKNSFQSPQVLPRRVQSSRKSKEPISLRLPQSNDTSTQSQRVDSSKNESRREPKTEERKKIGEE